MQNSVCRSEPSRDYSVEVWRNVLIVVWHRQTTKEGVRALRARAVEMTRGSNKGWFLLVVIEPGAKPPDSSTRDALAKVLTELGDQILSAAMVVEGSSLRSSFARGITTGLMVLARHSFPFKVTSVRGAVSQFAACIRPSEYLVELPHQVATMCTNARQ